MLAVNPASCTSAAPHQDAAFVVFFAFRRLSIGIVLFIASEYYSDIPPSFVSRNSILVQSVCPFRGDCITAIFFFVFRRLSIGIRQHKGTTFFRDMLIFLLVECFFSFLKRSSFHSGLCLKNGKRNNRLSKAK